MLYPRLTNCSECGDIVSLLQEIECKIAEIAKSLYNNIVFDLNNQISSTVMMDLLNYKRILLYKLINPLYAGGYTVNNIASKVKLLKFK